MGKKISILGDSISTYAGYSNNVIDRSDPACNYPNTNQQHGNVDDVAKTWWKNVSVQLEGQIVSNDSISGSCVAFYGSGTGHAAREFCMNNQTRINDLGDSNVTSSNHPDIIMFFGGTNDVCQIKDFDNTTFINSYSNAVRMMFERYSNKITILCITPYDSPMTTGFEWATDSKTIEENEKKQKNFQQVCSGIALVVQHYRNYGYDCKLVSLQDIKMQQFGDIDDIWHPNKLGMDKIADRVAYVQKYGY